MVHSTPAKSVMKLYLNGLNTPIESQSWESERGEWKSWLKAQHSEN